MRDNFRFSHFFVVKILSVRLDRHGVVGARRDDAPPQRVEVGHEVHRRQDREGDGELGLRAAGQGVGEEGAGQA